MRAVAIDGYGSGSYSVREVDDPTTGPDRIVIKVHAAGVNPVDYKILDGLLEGAFPTIWPLIPGWDFAGRIVEVGPAVAVVRPELVPGAEVIGYARKDFVGAGTWAEMVAMQPRGVALAPRTLDAPHAACLPLAGLTAYQLLTEAVAVEPGDVVLIHAASGGVGHLAIQIARTLGAKVIGSTSKSNFAFVRGLGAEPVQYGPDLPAQVRSLAPTGVDAAIDLVGGVAVDQTLELLKPGGKWATIVESARAAKDGGVYVFVRPVAAQLRELVRLADAGELRPQVSSTYPLNEVNEAIRESVNGVQGKVVLTVG